MVASVTNSPHRRSVGSLLRGQVVGRRETRQKATSLALRNPRPIRLDPDPLNLIE